MRLRSLAAVFLAPVAFMLVACGHPATETECRAILSKNVEIQLKSVEKTTPEVFAKKRKEYEASFEGELKDCVGKRVTDALLACIQAADTDEKVSACGR
jgi:hypothetical protein